MQPDGINLVSGAQMTISPRPTLSTVKALLESARLPIEDLTESHCENFFFAGEAGAPIGIVGLQIHGDVALLRSLVVSSEKRTAGLGTALVAHAEQAARASGVRVMYLLTTTAETFFLARGYERAQRESAPPAIRSTREFAGICPASSAFMMRTI
jgi:amino-acid N-acetyltransferase